VTTVYLVWLRDARGCSSVLRAFGSKAEAEAYTERLKPFTAILLIEDLWIDALEVD
jgi:hypothetical protein